MTKFKNLYEITFGTKQNKQWRKHMIHIEAFNAKEAKEEAKKLWYEAYKAHMFDISSRRVPEDEVVDMMHWFVPCH